MNIIVTGGGGFVGSWIAKQLVRDGHNVLVSDDLSGGTENNLREIAELPSKSHIYIYAGPCETISKGTIEDFGGVDVLVHCAANAREGASQFQPASVTKRNMFAYSAILSNCISMGVKDIVCFSSMSVYGKGTQPPPFNEDQILAPEDVYAVNKAAMEHCTAILSDVHGFNYVVIRPHNIIGPNQALFDRYRNVAGIWMNKIMRGEALPVFGDGEQTRAFSYIEDSMPCYMKAIYETKSLHGHAINVGGMHPITLNTLCDAVCEEFGVVDYPRIYLKERPKEVKHAHCTYAKSQTMLDYEEKIGWREGVKIMSDWAKTMGPQEWRDTEGLEILNDKTPTSWVEGGEGNK